MHHPTDRIAHTTVFVTPVVEHWPPGEETDLEDKRTKLRTRKEVSVGMFCQEVSVGSEFAASFSCLPNLSPHLGASAPRLV